MIENRYRSEFNTTKIAVKVVSCIGLAAIALLLAYSPCSDKVTAKALSDDGQLVAATYERSVVRPLTTA